MRTTVTPWNLWFRWTLANVVGWLFGLILSGILVTIQSIVALAIENVMGGGATYGWELEVFLITLIVGVGGVNGTVIGMKQRSVLQQHIVALSKWVWMSVVGWSVGLILGGLLGMAAAAIELVINFESPLFTLLPLISAGLFGGAVIGTAQWVTLHQHLPHTRWWVLANSLGFGLAVPIGLAANMAIFTLLSKTIFASLLEDVAGLIFLMVSGIAPLSFAIVYSIIGGTINGAITGGILVWLIRQSPSTEGKYQAS